MPVIGHAFVGLATAWCTRPGGGVRSNACPQSEPPSWRLRFGPAVRPWFCSAFWSPIVVTLAYLPDIASQSAILCGVADPRIATHSVFFAVAASLAVGIGLMKLGSISFSRAFGVSLASMLIHDALDVLQSTHQRPWWPLSEQTLRLNAHPIPVNSYREVLVFGAAFGLFLLGYTIIRRRRAPGADDDSDAGARSARVAVRTRSSYGAPWREGRPGRRPISWVSGLLTVAILLTASATHYLRGVRERDLARIRTLLERHQYVTALSLIRRTERWPATAKPGRLDYAKAEALAGIGERDRAAHYYLRAFQADPSYFWALADLTVLYASGEDPPADRRRRAAPYLQRLQNEFAHHRALPHVLAKINKALSRASP